MEHTLVEELEDYIERVDNGNKAAFARTEGYSQRGIPARMIKAGYIVVGGVLYSPRKILKRR